MSCPCGSTKCVCEKTCLCPEINCHCIKCQLLEKICPRCNLPSYVIILKEDCERQICSCDKQEAAFNSAQSDLQTAASAMGDTSSISPVRREQCPRCSLPLLIVSAVDDYEGKVFYCCSSLKNLSTDNPDMSTDHETSTCTSDHREVWADRQVQKALDRKTRTEVPKWQAKKVNDRSFNSAEEISYTETVDANGNIENLNSDSNTQSQTGHSSRADDTSTGNVSLLVNTSGIASPSTSKSFSEGESLGFFQINPAIKNVRATLPDPFPRLPIPIPGPPAFGGQKGQFPNPPVNRPPRTPHPFQSEQPKVARGEMIKSFETLQDAMNTSEELPGTETAAALNKEDKEWLKEELGDKAEGQSEKQPEKKLVEQSKDSSNSGEVPAFKSPVNVQKNGKDDIDPTTDT